VASLAAAIGDPVNYTDARQVFRRSGLVSGRNDSGNRQCKGKGNAILKTGDVYLRRALMSATATLILHQPVLVVVCISGLNASKLMQMSQVSGRQICLGYPVVHRGFQLIEPARESNV
jgi:hypothetical protein